MLDKTDEREAYLTLLGIMAKTPRGSWAGHSSFGFNEFFTVFSREGLSPEQRTRLADATVSQINSVLADLGLARYHVDSLTCGTSESDAGRDRGGTRHAGPAANDHVVTLMLREQESNRVTMCIV